MDGLEVVMASKHRDMWRYVFDPSQSWQQRVVNAATLYRQRTGASPTVAHVSRLHADAPAQVGIVRIERAWGLGKNEIDLG
jgi:hypothetical protein